MHPDEEPPASQHPPGTQGASEQGSNQGPEPDAGSEAEPGSPAAGSSGAPAAQYQTPAGLDEQISAPGQPDETDAGRLEQGDPYEGFSAPPEETASFAPHDEADDASAYERTEPSPASLFAPPLRQPYIALPGEERGDPRRARDAQANLDLDLARIKRRKRFGILLTTLSVLFVALVAAPVTWTLVYLFVDAPSTVLMLERAAEGQNIRHTAVPIARMSPYIVRSVIAAEDANFCTHHGFDVAAIEDAMAVNAEGGRVRGGSTISQQTAKNLFLWPERSWVRKGFETYFTALIEFMWPKRRIMEQYLNAAEFGGGVFGVEAAAQTRFGVSAADLTPLEAARLAAVLPSPNRWSATDPGPYVRERSASIVARAQVIHNQHMAGCVLALDAAAPA